ncbi:MAG: RimK family alpha-L-glutamate ligase [Gemmatimonadales bacterium]
MKRIGLIVGREWSWPPAFIEEVQRRDEGVVAEFVKLGGPRMDDPSAYSVIIDRISHEVPFYRAYLKHAVLQGVTVVNNPFMWSADDKFFGATLATSLGLASPKTVLLPNKEYIPGIVHTESLPTWPSRSTGRRSSSTWGSPASSRTRTAAAGVTSTSATPSRSCSTTTTSPACSR